MGPRDGQGSEAGLRERVGEVVRRLEFAEFALDLDLPDAGGRDVDDRGGRDPLTRRGAQRCVVAEQPQRYAGVEQDAARARVPSNNASTSGWASSKVSAS